MQLQTEGRVLTRPTENGSRPRETRRKSVRPRLSVVLPTRNEAENIELLVARLQAVAPQVPTEIIFVDDSDDSTAEVAQSVADRSSRCVRVIHRAPDQRGDGLSGAVVQGMLAARGEWVCVMDADLQHPPELIEQLLERAESGDVDIVLASRYRDDRLSKGFGRLRALLSRGTTAAARTLFPSRLRNVSDPMSGFFLVRRSALDLEALRPRGFKILLEILVRTPALRSAEVPFEFGERHAGESKASLREGLRYVGQLSNLRVGGSATRFAQFGLVGASGLVLNMVLLYALTSLAGIFYLASAVVATQGSTLWNFALTETWVFRDRELKLGRKTRLASFMLVNNAALVVRAPLLVLLTSGLGVDYLLSNLITLVALVAVRYPLADSWTWGNKDAVAREPRWHSYDIHGIIKVASQVALPELERFRCESLSGKPTIRIRIGKLNKAQSELVSALAFMTRHIRYDEGLGRFGFGVEISTGKSTEVVASPLLRRSPHVLYTNVVEPILRWAFVKKGYALVHAASVAFGDRAFLVTAKTDTGKTTTILRTLDRHRCSFLSDDLVLITPDGRVLPYPKPLTISRHTLRAVKTPLLTWQERLALVFQSRLHSRSGRQFGLLLARMRIPAATVNAIVQFLIPPPKYHVERLVPGVETAEEARLAGMIVIERGGSEEVSLSDSEALDILMSNCEDSYGFPPYSSIEHFLHSGNGRDLRAEEREIVQRALRGLPSTLLKSETMNWWQSLPAIVGSELRPELSVRVSPVPSGAMPMVTVD